MKNWMMKSAILFCTTLLLIACEDKGGGEVKLVIELNKPALSLQVGDSETLIATLTPEGTSLTYTWSSDNEAVATVADGTVAAIAVGEATITVSAGDRISASCKVTVSSVGVTGISLNKTTLALTTGDVETLTATVEPENAADKSVVWSSDNKAVATVADGTVAAIAPGEAVITATAGEFSAECIVTVSSVGVTGISLNKTTLALTTGDVETLTATVEPENAPDKSVVWSSNNKAVATVADGTVAAIAPGEAVITATAGEFSAECTVTVSNAPKIGDYYYSDGTWSDGGLISIEPHGLNPVWNTQKPAPIAGKTVVGIVFQTFPERLAASDKEKGFTHGYVMAVKNAHGPDKLTTWYSTDYEFECLKPAKTSDVWYWNVNGYNETMTVRDEYKAAINKCPAFDWTINGFGLQAPGSSSGWFVPSTGQLWDMIANLCGHEAAVVMKDWEDKKLNAGYGYATGTVTYDVIAKFNESMSMISAENKEEMFITSSAFYSSCSIWASTPCTLGETACIINIGTKGLVELYEEYTDGDCVARPILAF